MTAPHAVQIDGSPAQEWPHKMEAVVLDRLTHVVRCRQCYAEDPQGFELEYFRRPITVTDLVEAAGNHRRALREREGG